MAITLLSQGAQVENTAASTTLAVPYPITLNSSAIMVLAVSASSTTSFPTLPAGWTQVFRSSNTAGTLVPSILLAIKQSTGSESGTLSVTTPNVVSLGQILAFSGVDLTTPQDTTATSIDQTTASTSSVIPTLTTTLSGAALVYVAGQNSAVANASPPTSPDNFTETADRSTGTRSATVGYLIWTSFGATGSVTVSWGASSSKSLGVMLALRPAITAAGGAVAMTATATMTAAGVIPAAGSAMTATHTLTVGAVRKQFGAVAMTTTATLTAVGDLGYTLYDYEEGSNGAAIPNSANGVVVLVGAPTYATASAMHGSLGLKSTGSQMVGYDNPNSASNSGSVYFRVDTFSTTARTTIVRFTDSPATTALSTISLNTTGTICIATGAGTSLAATTVTTVAGVFGRVDYQSTWVGSTMTITARVFLGANVEGRTPDQTITATTTHTEPFRILVGSSNSTWVTSSDTFRVASGAQWLGPYNPSIVPGTVVHVWSGDPLANSFKVTCKTLNASSVRLAVSASAGMTSRLYYSAVAPDALGYVSYDAVGLAANTQYYYQLADTPVSGTEALIGTVSKAHTLPAPGSLASFTVALVSCQANDSGVSAAWDDLVAWAPTFVCHVGDLHYKSSTSIDPDVHSGLLAAQIANAGGLKAALAAQPVIYVNSDHEAGTDNGDSNNAWSAAFNTAYRQVVPSRLVDTLPSPVSKHRSWVVGRVRFILVDCRSTDRSPGANVDDANKTLLGVNQKAWLKSQLLLSEPVKVIVCDIPWMGTALGFQWQDKWQSYGTERQELATFINANGVKVDFWHGDSHYVAVDQTHNIWGGFPNICGSPLDNLGSSTDITFFDSSYTVGPSASASSFMRITFTDDGTTITRTASGWDALADVQRVSQVFTWTSIATATVAMTETSTMTIGGVRTRLGTVAMSAAHTLTATVVAATTAPRKIQFRRNTPLAADAGGAQLDFGEPGWDGSGIRVGGLVPTPWASLPHTVMSDELGSLTVVSSNYSIARSQRTVIANGLNLTLTLHSPLAVSGTFHTVKNLNATVLTVATVASTIDGAATITLAQWDSASFVSDGGQWFRL